MKAGTFNITLTEGVGFSKRMTWRSGGLIVPLDTYGARLRVRHPTQTDVYLLTLERNEGILLSDESPNIVIEFTEAQVEALGDALPQGITKYRLDLIPPAGEGQSFPLFGGELKVEAW